MVSAEANASSAKTAGQLELVPALPALQPAQPRAALRLQVSGRRPCCGNEAQSSKPSLQRLPRLSDEMRELQRMMLTSGRSSIS